MATSESPAVILLDMNIPIMDGWSGTSVKSKSEYPGGIPIPGLSAHAMTLD